MSVMAEKAMVEATAGFTPPQKVAGVQGAVPWAVVVSAPEGDSSAWASWDVSFGRRHGEVEQTGERPSQSPSIEMT